MEVEHLGYCSIRGHLKEEAVVRTGKSKHFAPQHNQMRLMEQKGRPDTRSSSALLADFNVFRLWAQKRKCNGRFIVNKDSKKGKWQHFFLFVTTYTSPAHMIKNTVLKRWHILTSDPALTQHFKDPPLFVYKRGPNLKDKLVRDNILPRPKQTLLAQLELGNYPCCNCAQCHNTSKTNVFRHQGKHFQ